MERDPFEHWHGADETAAATDTAALVAFLRALETGDDPADATRGEQLIDWLMHAVDHPDDALDGGMLLRVYGPPASGKGVLARLVQALLPPNRCFIDHEAEQLYRPGPLLPPHPVRRAFCVINVDNVMAGPVFGDLGMRPLFTLHKNVFVYADATRHLLVRLPPPAVGGRRSYIARAAAGALWNPQAIAGLAAVLTTAWPAPRYRWARVRAFVKARAIALYWQDLTSHLYAPGQVGAARDAIAYQTDEVLRGACCELGR